MPNNCIFCKIANKEIPANIVFENEYILAFKDLHPKAPTHLLVIPKKHFENLNDLNEEILMTKLISGIKEITQTNNISDYKLQVNNGKNAGQEVFHLHFHILSNQKI